MDTMLANVSSTACYCHLQSTWLSNRNVINQYNAMCLHMYHCFCAMLCFCSCCARSLSLVASALCSLVVCLLLPIASACAGTSEVMTEPAATSAPCPTVTGATSVEFEPMKASAAMDVLFFAMPSAAAMIIDQLMRLLLTCDCCSWRTYTCWSPRFLCSFDGCLHKHNLKADLGLGLLPVLLEICI